MALGKKYYPGTEEAKNPTCQRGECLRASLARRVSMCKDAKLSCRGNILFRTPRANGPTRRLKACFDRMKPTVSGISLSRPGRSRPHRFRHSPPAELNGGRDRSAGTD